jgi:hypothetical protein
MPREWGVQRNKQKKAEAKRAANAERENLTLKPFLKIKGEGIPKEPKVKKVHKVQKLKVKNST